MRCPRRAEDCSVTLGNIRGRYEPEKLHLAGISQEDNVDADAGCQEKH